MPEQSDGRSTDGKTLSKDDMALLRDPPVGSIDRKEKVIVGVGMGCLVVMLIVIVIAVVAILRVLDSIAGSMRGV